MKKVKKKLKPVAWVVGGIRGLGVMVAKGLAEDGYNLALSYHTSQERAQEFKKELNKFDCAVLLCQGDVGNAVDVERMANEVVGHYGRVDVLVCMAGPFIFNSTELTAYSHDEWQEMINGNVSGVFYCIKEVVPVMREQKSGRIITFGFSQIDQVPAWKGYGAYAAAKVGVASLTRTLAKEEASYGITVNMICPGDIRDPYKEATIADARLEKMKMSPVGRPGSGEDVSRVVRFLAHTDSDFITGAIIPVTGGYSTV